MIGGSDIQYDSYWDDSYYIYSDIIESIYKSKGNIQKYLSLSVEENVWYDNGNGKVSATIKRIYYNEASAKIIELTLDAGEKDQVIQIKEKDFNTSIQKKPFWVKFKFIESGDKLSKSMLEKENLDYSIIYEGVIINKSNKKWNITFKHKYYRPGYTIDNLDKYAIKEKPYDIELRDAIIEKNQLQHPHLKSDYKIIRTERSWNTIKKEDYQIFGYEFTQNDKEKCLKSFDLKSIIDPENVDFNQNKNHLFISW